MAFTGAGMVSGTGAFRSTTNWKFVQGRISAFGVATATVNTEAYLGVSERKGTIEKGKQADLLLLDKNPLEDIRNTRSISGLWIGGKYYNQKGIEKMLEAAKILGR